MDANAYLLSLTELNVSLVAGIAPESSLVRAHNHSWRCGVCVNYDLSVDRSGWNCLWRGDTAAAPDGPCLVALLALHVLAAAGTLDAAGHNCDRDEVKGNGCTTQNTTNKPSSSRW